jgi:taurine dioxygenase
MPETVQPLVVTHPVTGRKGLYLNTARMEGVLGMDRDEADALIAELMGRATHPRYEYRHAWRAGDLVIWDNRTVLIRPTATCHRGSAATSTASW